MSERASTTPQGDPGRHIAVDDVRRGDVLWCRFPTEDAPGRPAAKSRPVVVLADARKNWVRVVAGHTRRDLQASERHHDSLRGRIAIGPADGPAKAGPPSDAQKLHSQWLAADGKGAPWRRSGLDHTTVFEFDKVLTLPLTGDFFANRRNDDERGRLSERVMRDHIDVGVAHHGGDEQRDFAARHQSEVIAHARAAKARRDALARDPGRPQTVEALRERQGRTDAQLRHARELPKTPSPANTNDRVDDPGRAARAAPPAATPRTARPKLRLNHERA